MCQRRTSFLLKHMAFHYYTWRPEQEVVPLGDEEDNRFHGHSSPGEEIDEPNYR